MYFQNDSVKVVMLVKVHPHRLRDQQLFVAGCVIWEKNDSDGTIICREAHDFGTMEMHARGGEVVFTQANQIIL